MFVLIIGGMLEFTTVYAPLLCFDICFYGSTKSILLEKNAETQET